MVDFDARALDTMLPKLRLDPILEARHFPGGPVVQQDEFLEGLPPFVGVVYRVDKTAAHQLGEFAGRLFVVELLSLLRDGQHADVIERTTSAAALSEDPDECLYFRGLPGFGEARDGGLRRHLGRSVARAIVPPVAPSIPAQPSCAEKCQRCGTRCLPTSHQLLEQVYGLQPPPTRIYILDDCETFRLFYSKMVSDGTPVSWYKGAAGIRVVLLLRSEADGTLVSHPGSAKQAAIANHELTHVLVAEHIGSVAPWVDEGLAVWAGAQVRPALFHDNDQWVTDIVKGGRQLEIETLSDPCLFYEEGHVRDAYEQSFGMTGVLIDNIGVERLPDFLDKLERHGDADAALAVGWGIDSSDLVEEWHEAVSRRMVDS